MPRLRFHANLLIAFAAVLLPVLGLLGADFFMSLRRTQETILEAQSLTAQAVAVQISESFDSAIEFGRAVANDPLVRELDPQRLDAHLQRLVKHSPLYDAIGVYDANGINRGWGDPDVPAEPRLRITDRPYFRTVMATNAPVISEVIELRRPTRMAILASVPIRGPEGRPVGVVNVVMQTDLLEQRYLSARLQSGQNILLVDPGGRLAFHTGHPDLTYEQSNAFLAFAPIHEALDGTSVRLDEFTSPLRGDVRLGAFVPTHHYPWAVGVTAPRDVAMAPLHEWLRMKMGVFAGILLLSAFMAARMARRQSEVDALRAEAEHHARQLAAVIASVPDAIFLASPEERLIDANPAGFRLLGFKDRSELGQPLSEYLQRYDFRHSDGRLVASAETPIRRALAGESFTDMELCLRRSDGEQRQVSINGAPVRDPSGRIVFGEIVVRDITERKQAEEERVQLLAREQALARIGQALVREVELPRVSQVVIEQSLGALGADAIGLWLAGPEQSELTLVAAYCLPQKIQERVRRLSLESPLLTAHAARLGTLQVAENMLAEEVPSLTRTLVMSAGFESMVAVPLHSHDRLVGVLTCLSHAPRCFSARELEFHTTVGQLFAMALEKARLFQEVRRTLRLREEFMSAAAHELRTPTTTIRTWAELLLKLEAGSLRQQKGLAAIARSTRRLARLVEHLFDAVWMAPGRPKLERTRFNLEHLVVEKVQELSQVAENPIHIEGGGELFIDADRQRMGEVVAHLLENAIRYSPPDGLIEVELRGEGGEAVVSVRDHGPGIPPERQPHVFEPLYEPLPPGAPGYAGVVGLGLYLSWQIIEAHGGRIWLESTPGEGTTFRFSMPLGEADSLHYAQA